MKWPPIQPADTEKAHKIRLFKLCLKSIQFSRRYRTRLKQDSVKLCLILTQFQRWNNTLIDGHNRYEICQRHNIPFKTIEKDFADRTAAIVWIIQNQLARRNLPAYERARLALRLKPAVAEKAKENQAVYYGNQYESGLCQKSDKVQNVDTKKIIARAAGVSHDTIAKVEALEKSATPEIKRQLRTGEISINQAYNKTRQGEKRSEIREAKQGSDRQKTGQKQGVKTPAGTPENAHFISKTGNSKILVRKVPILPPFSLCWLLKSPPKGGRGSAQRARACEVTCLTAPENQKGVIPGFSVKKPKGRRPISPGNQKGYSQFAGKELLTQMCEAQTLFSFNGSSGKKS